MTCLSSFNCVGLGFKCKMSDQVQNFRWVSIGRGAQESCPVTHLIERQPYDRYIYPAVMMAILFGIFYFYQMSPLPVFELSRVFLKWAGFSRVQRWPIGWCLIAFYYFIAWHQCRSMSNVVETKRASSLSQEKHISRLFTALISRKITRLPFLWVFQIKFTGSRLPYL